MAQKPEATGTEVAVANTNSALPTFLQGGRTDKTEFDRRDLTIPRIKLAQDLSPEVKSGELKAGSLFLNLTTEALATPQEPLRFIPVVVGKEYVIWKDRLDDGGGLLARARPVRMPDGSIKYKWDKPNQEFKTKVKGVLPVTWKTGEYVEDDGLGEFGSSVVDDENSPPAASIHYNYLVILPDHGNMLAAFSMSKSQVKKARSLNALIETGNVNMYARFFKAYIKTEKSRDNPGEYWNVDFKPAGIMQQADEDLYNFAKSQHEYFVEQGFIVDQSDGHNDDAPKSSAGRF